MRQVKTGKTSIHLLVMSIAASAFYLYFDCEAKSTKLFTLRASHQGGDELRTSVYPSNFAPIAAKLRQRAFQTICKFRFFDAEIFFSEKIGFSSFSVDFRGARLFLTSKSSSSRFFASDGQIFGSVRRLGLIFRFFTVRTSSCGGKARVTEIPGGRSHPDPPRGPRHG